MTNKFNIAIADRPALITFLASVVFQVPESAFEGVTQYAFGSPIPGTPFVARCNVWGSRESVQRPDNSFEMVVPSSDPGSTPYGDDEIFFTRGRTYYYAKITNTFGTTTHRITSPDMGVWLDTHRSGQHDGIQFGQSIGSGPYQGDESAYLLYGENYPHAVSNTLGTILWYNMSTVVYGPNTGSKLYVTVDASFRSSLESTAGIPAGVTSAVTTLIDAADDTNADTKATEALQAYEAVFPTAGITPENKRGILKGVMRDLLLRLTTAVPEVAKDRVAAFLPHLTGAALAAMPAEIEVRGAGSHSVDLMSKGTYTPLDDGETLTLTDTSFSPSKVFAVTNTSDVFSLTVDGTTVDLGSDNTPGSTYTWTDGTRTLYFTFGSVVVGGGAASGGSGDPYLTTLLG